MLKILEFSIDLNIVAVIVQLPMICQLSDFLPIAWTKTIPENQPSTADGRTDEDSQRASRTISVHLEASRQRMLLVRMFNCQLYETYRKWSSFASYDDWLRHVIVLYEQRKILHLKQYTTTTLLMQWKRTDDSRGN